MLYLDASAAVKLVVEEPESAALFDVWNGDRSFVASDLLRVELLRATRRVDPDRVELAEELLADLHLLAITRSVVHGAASIGSGRLRSLDAIHLASALELADDLDGLVTYDERLAAGASELGLAVVSPT